MSYFSHVERFPDDPILQLPILFAKDPRKNKINLGIGAYKDDLGQSFILPCVKEAEKILFEKESNKDYLPIEGDSPFIRETLKRVCGKFAERAFALQTVGGTAALRLGGEFLKNNGFSEIFVSQPSWPNHLLIFKHAGLAYKEYPYYDFQRNSFHFSGMCEALHQMPPNSIVLLHASCHNPTGMDPSKEQWKEISAIIKKRKLFPFFDLAYQGFGKGLEEDTFSIRYFIEQQHELFVACSNAKNMGLYGERVGMLAFVANEEAMPSIASQLKQMARASYSNPPLHGAKIASFILESERLSKEWERELEKMRLRIEQTRHALIQRLERQVAKDLSFLKEQLGIFSFIGLNPDQVKNIREHFGIYMPTNGRINIAGINPSNIDAVLLALTAVLQ